MMNGIGVGEDRVQQRRPRLDLRKDRANSFRRRFDLAPGESRKIENLRDARDPDLVRRALATNKRLT
jgi:hypothetical protein